MRRTRIEVAALLPTGAAAALMHCPPKIQQAVVDTVGSCVEEWEASGVNLDPMQLDAVVNTLVGILLAHVTTVDEIRRNPLLWRNAEHSSAAQDPPQPLA